MKNERERERGEGRRQRDERQRESHRQDQINTRFIRHRATEEEGRSGGVFVWGGEKRRGEEFENTHSGDPIISNDNKIEPRISRNLPANRFSLVHNLIRDTQPATLLTFPQNTATTKTERRARERAKNTPKKKPEAQTKTRSSEWDNGLKKRQRGSVK